MLDKSIPYKHFIMAISPDAIAKTVVAALPEGFAYRLFRDGDEKHWARIETSVLEFIDATMAESYFVAYYLPELDELKKRCVFVVNSDGLPVATATAWFEKETDPCGYRPTLHWVSAHPDYQGLGLGRAVVSKALSLFPALHPGKEAFLHTQTWSHRAVWLYHLMGFNLCRTRSVVQNQHRDFFPNEYEEGLEILRGVIDQNKANELAATSVE